MRVCAGFASRRPLLVLVTLPVLALDEMLFCGVDSTVDLLVMLMVGVAFGDSRYLPIGLSACSGCAWA